MTPRIVSAALLLLSAAGCGPAVAPVSGRVTLDGRPLAGARVSFQPTGGDPKKLPPGSVGDTDADGRYTLRLIRGGGQRGAAVGPHRVAVSANSSPATERRTEEVAAKPGEAGMELVPERYNAETTLGFDVPSGGTDAADFPLTSR